MPYKTREYTTREITRPTPTSRDRDLTVNQVLPVAALALSILSLLGVGAILSNLSNFRQELNTLEGSVSQLSATVAQMPTSTTPLPSQTTTDLSESNSSATTSSTFVIQPRQFVQPVLSQKAEVELLKVNRLENDQNVVNVQFRVRLLQSNNTNRSDVIDPANIIALDPISGQTYRVNQTGSSSEVSLAVMEYNNQTSKDAYVWLQIPEEVNFIDIYLPDGQIFRNVPITL